MSMMRYTYDYNGMRYTIDAPAGATAEDLQALIGGGPQQAAQPPAQPPADPMRAHKARLAEMDSAISSLENEVAAGKGQFGTAPRMGVSGSAKYQLNALRVQRAGLQRDIEEGPSTGILGDLGAQLRAGLAGWDTGLGYLTGQREVETQGRQNQRLAQESMSARGQEVAQKGVLGENMAFGDRAYAAALGVTRSVPDLVGGMLAAGAIAAAAPEAATAALGARVLSLATKAPRVAKLFGITAGAGGREAALSAGRTVLAEVAGSGVEGAQAGLYAGSDTKAAVLEQIEKDPEAFAKSDLGKKLLTLYNGDLEAAKNAAADQLGRENAIATGLATSLLAIPGAVFEARLIRGAHTGSIGRELGLGAVAETLQEGPQSGAEQAFSNIALQRAGSNVDTLSGVAKAAGEGAIVGALMGGGLGGVGAVGKKLGASEERPATEQDVAESPEVQQEYLRLVSEQTAARMEAEPGLTQRQAFDRVLKDSASLYDTAVTNILGGTTPSGEADVDTGLDVSGGAEPSVSPAGATVPAGAVPGEREPSTAGGVGEPTTGVSAVTPSTTAGEPTLDLGEFAPTVATLQEAPNNKVRKPVAMQLVSDVVQANPDLQGLSKNKYSQAANQMVQAAARGEQFDPVAIVQGVAPKPKAAPEVETASEQVFEDIGEEPGGNVTSLGERRAAKVMPKVEALLAGEISMHPDDIGDLADDLDDLRKAGGIDEATFDNLEDQLFMLERRTRAAMRPQNDNAPETPLQKAERELSAAGDAFNSFFYNPDDERMYARKNSNAFKEWLREYEALNSTVEEKHAAWNAAWQDEYGSTLEDIGGTPAPTDLTDQPSSNTIYALAQELPTTARVSVRARLDRILARHAKDGDIERLVGSLEALRQDVDRRIDRERTKRGRERVRGFERAMEVIYRAERTGQLSPEGAGLIRWLLEQNPAIADELAISIREGAGQKAAGQYSPAARVATIFASRANDGTAAHEVLHHTERLMPENVRVGIRAAWMKRIQDLIALADKTNNTNMREVLGTIVRAYYGDTEAQKILKESFEAGTIPYSAYHLSNPSEFWAVNATDLVGKRAKQTGWLGAARAWLRGLIEKAKDLFGLTNDSAVITGLKAVLAVESGTVSGAMLSDKSDVFRVYGGEGATNPNRSKLAEAQALEVAEGAISGPTGNIRTQTGWFRGVDGMWRFEIDDRDMRFQPGYEPIRLVKGRTYLLGQIIAHPELFRQYPSLQQVNVVVKDTEGGGYWDWTENEIAISDETPTIESYYLNTLAHEIQHAVQRWENFADGASQKQYPVSSAAVRKALSFLDKFKGSSLFLWDKTYKRADLKAMRDDLEVLRDTFGSSLDKAYADWESYEQSVYELNNERWQRRRDAVDAWWGSDHPEAVKHRELQDARIALGKQLQDYEYQRTLTPEERATLKKRFDAAAGASQAQYKYAAGLADMLAQPDISDLETRFKELASVTEGVGKRIAQAQDIAGLHGANKLMYYLTAGEVEARDVERRRMMSPFQREREVPYVSDPFGELSDMILVDQISGRSSAPPKVVSNGKPVTLTEAQTRAALEKVEATRRKLNRIQKRIANTNRTADVLSGQIELGKLARGDKENLALLRGVVDTLDVGKWKLILPILSEEDIFRILKGRIPGLDEADRIIRQDVTRFETKEYQALEEQLKQIADFLKKHPKAAQALSDLQFASVAYQVDPSKAANAEEYADKFDKKTRELRAELNNTAVTDAKKQRSLKTKIDNRLKDIRSVYEGALLDDGRVFGWRDLARPELGANKGKEIFKLIRDAHRRDLEASYNAIKSRLEETKEGEKLDEALEKLEEQFKPAREQIIYFPAMRFGQFYARVGTGANSIFKMFETETKRNQFMRLMKVRGEEITQFGNVDDLRSQFESVTGSPLKDVLDLFEDNPRDIAALRSQVFDLWLQTMSAGDMRKHMAPRMMRAGYSTDILKNFANFRRSSINSAKRARFGYKLRNEISRAKDSIEGQPDRAKMQEFVKEVELRVMSDLTPPERGNTIWQQVLRFGNKVAFYQYLANPKTATIQLTQMHIVALPMLAQKYGHIKATAALGKYGFSSLGGFVASPLKAIKREDGSFVFDWEQPNLLDNPISSLKKESDPELYEVLSEGWQEGRDINLYMDTFANDIGGYGMADPKQRNALQELAAGRVLPATLRGATFVFESMGTLMHQMERVNREAVYMAALELGYRENRKKGQTHEAAKKAAIEEATADTLAATFDFSAYNKPRVLTTPVGRVAGQFMPYPYMMTSLMMRKMYTAIKVSGLEPGERSAAIKVATGTFANLILYGGLTALPLYGVFKVMGYLLTSLFGEDDDTDWDWWFRNEWIPQFFGPDGTVANLLGLDDAQAELLARSVEKGPISALTDVDLSNSVALDFMFFLPEASRAETPEGQVRETVFNMVTGAAGGALMDYVKAGRDVATGYSERALEKMPKVISNVAKAIRFGAEGQLNYAGELAGMGKEFWTSDKQILLALGFNSTEAAQRQQQNYEGRAITKKVEKARETALSQYRKVAIDVEKAGGMTDELRPDYDAAIEAVNEFNTAHPEQLISPNTLFETQANAVLKMRESQFYEGVPVEKRGKTPHLEDILHRRVDQDEE